jgi:hypothetical protein
MDNAVEYPEWKELVKHAITWDYGTVHSHQEISSIMLLKPFTRKYYTMVSRASKELRDYGKVIVSLPKQGYKVIAPDEYVGHAIKYVEAGSKRIKTAHSILDCAPVDKMTVPGRTRFNMVYDRMAAFYAFMQGGVKELKTLERTHLRLNEGRE